LGRRSGNWALRGVVLLGAVLACSLAILPQARGVVAATCARDQQGQVRIVGRTLKPATIRIGPGKSVTWIACGAGNRTIESTSRPRAWTTFSLRPNQQRRITFNRVGRYPYKLNGKVSGLVVVAVAGTGTAPGQGQGQNERTIRYDVRVEANYTYRQTLDGGLVQTTMAYVGTWTNLPVKIFDGFGTFTAVGRLETGRIDAKLTYSDARGNTRCQGEVDYPPYAAEAAITAGRPKGQAPYVSFGSNFNDDGPFQDLTNARTTACDDLPASDGRAVWLLESEFLPGTQGVLIHPPGAGIADTDARFHRNGGAGLPFPIDRLREHRGFTIVGQGSVGPGSCGAGCTESSTGRVEFVFTPRG
jgi:plastocyanin